MSNTGTKIIEKGSTAGGIAKVQYLDESGNVLYEVNDSDKILKMVNGKISGLAGTGNRMVTADSSGNLSASGEITERIYAKGQILTNSAGIAGSGSSAYIKSTNGYSAPTTPDYTFWNNDQTGIYHPSADNLGITTGGVSRALFNPNGVTIPSLAGAGQRGVVAREDGRLGVTGGDFILRIPSLSSTPISTGININGGDEGKIIMAYLSGQWSVGIHTSSALIMIRCGYNGDNFSSTVISSDNYIYPVTFTQVSGTLYVSSAVTHAVRIRFITN